MCCNRRLVPLQFYCTNPLCTVKGWRCQHGCYRFVGCPSVIWIPRFITKVLHWIKIYSNVEAIWVYGTLWSYHQNVATETETLIRPDDIFPIFCCPVLMPMWTAASVSCSSGNPDLNNIRFKWLKSSYLPILTLSLYCVYEPKCVELLSYDWLLTLLCVRLSHKLFYYF